MSAQPEATASLDSHESIILGIYDRLLDHGHCSADVVLAPADATGEPDWENTGPANVSGLPSDQWPDNPTDAKRACVIVSDIDGCDPDSTFIVMLHAETSIPGLFQIHGPDADRDVADSIIGRDLGNRPPPKAPTKLQESIAKLTADLSAPKVAANDNNPPFDKRLLPYLAAFGGPDAIIAADGIYGAVVDGKPGKITITENGRALFSSRLVSKFVELPVKPAGLKIVSPSEWHGKPIPDREWFLADLVPARNVTLLSGDGGVGKSLLALQIAAASALGAETMGLSPRPGKVFYLGAEDEEDEFKRRLAQIVDGLGYGLADLKGKFQLSPMAGEDATLALPDRGKNMVPTAMMASLIDEVAAFRPDLLVLDTSADLFGGDEINRVQVRQFVGMLRKIAMSLDCAIVLLSHPSIQGMQSGSGLSGSTAWNNSVRSRLYLTADKDDDEARLLTTVKANYGKKGGGLKMRWQNGAFILDDGKPSVGSALLNAKAERVFRDVLSAINRTGERVAKTKGLNYAPKIIAERPEASGMSVKSLEAAMLRLLAAGELSVVMEGPPSKPRQRLLLKSEDFGPE